jgi:hypothetical protein
MKKKHFQIFLEIEFMNYVIFNVICNNYFDIKVIKMIKKFLIDRKIIGFIIYPLKKENVSPSANRYYHTKESYIQVL